MRQERPRVIGHRGAAAAAPENTLAGLRRAKALGADWVEVDVRLTRDGCPVLLHDDRLDRTTDGHGAVGEVAVAELHDLDAGAWFAPEFQGERVPRLDETIPLLGALGLGAVFELKPGPGRGADTARAALAVILRLWPGRLPAPIISSFDRAALAAARETAPRIERALIVGALPGDWAAQAKALGCSTLHADHNRLDRAAVADVSAQLPLFVYTVNSRERAEEVFAWGASAVFTDRPDLIISAKRNT
jgi:glycerophosphoryl diester phosphodiesterase